MQVIKASAGNVPDCCHPCDVSGVTTSADSGLQDLFATLVVSAWWNPLAQQSNSQQKCLKTTLHASGILNESASDCRTCAACCRRG
jgi:hypothetical protein